MSICNDIQLTESGNLHDLYHIRSNKRPGCLTKSLKVGAYLFQYFDKGQPKTPINTHPDTPG